MAAITDLSTASSVGTGDYLVISQSGTDKKVTANKFGLTGTASTFTAAQTFSGGITTTGVIATENGTGTPGIGASYATGITIASGEMYLLVVKSTGSPDTVNAIHASIIARQGTGVLISTILSTNQITPQCDAGTSYVIRIVNAGSLNWALEYNLLRLG